MENVEAAESLALAERLSGQARRAGRWYAGYLVVFAVASFVFAALFTFVDSARASMALTVLWTLFVAALTVWSARKRTTVVGMGRLHVTVLVVWGALWAVTVIVGATWFPRQAGWWLAGGTAMAVACLIGAWIAYRRSAN